MIIKWIGQSGYVLKTASTEIIIDPYLSDIVNKVANRPRLVPAPIAPENIACDAVICSHNHLDHLDTEAIEQMNDSLYFITTGECEAKLAEMGKLNVKSMSIGETVVVGDIKLTAVFANHTVEAFGLIVDADGMRLYFSGDTLFDEKLYEIASFNPDITFICINGKLGNMDVNEALIVAAGIGAKVNIPNHYGMFASNTEDPLKFADKINGGFILDFDREYTVSKKSQRITIE